MRYKRCGTFEVCLSCFNMSAFVCAQAQYILIHQALLEHNQFGETEISLSELHSTMNTLKEKNLDDEPTLMEEEFEVRRILSLL